MLKLTLKQWGAWGATYYVAGISHDPRLVILIHAEPVALAAGQTLEQVATILDEVTERDPDLEGYRLEQAAYVREVAA